MATLAPTFKDWVLRTWLERKSGVRYILNMKKKGTFAVPTDYTNIFADDFSTPYMANWDSGAEWGLPPYHPLFPKQWYDNDQITQTMDGVVFNAVMKPRYFPEIDKTIPNAIGIIRTKGSWKYGIFKITAMQPLGTRLWSALWLTGRFNNPPEIDINESYSDDTVDYHKNKKLQSNVHISNGAGGTNSAGARTHKLPNKVTQEFVDYVLWWEADFIKIYYNGYLVRHITDKRILDGMSEEQHIIIGTGVQDGFNADNLEPMVVRQVKVFQK
jgi:hypothetical protein